MHEQLYEHDLNRICLSKMFRNGSLSIFCKGLLIGACILVLITQVSFIQTYFDTGKITTSTKGNSLIRDRGITYNERIACIFFQGRLGNKMFQYAFLYAVWKKRGFYPVILNDFELMEIFLIPTVPVISGTLRNDCMTKPIIKERWACSYDEQVLSFSTDTDSIHFRGYFQSWRYWITLENEITNIFTFKKHIKDKALEKFGIILQSFQFQDYNRDIIVGIHARRGDHILEQEVKFGKLVPAPSYYKKAMNFFRKKFYPKRVLFIAVSDDIDWLQKALFSEDNVYFNNKNVPGVDMAIASMSNHMIMSVGSFGWWISWMTN